MAKIITHAVAKINLMLNITGMSGEGYHDIESVFVFLKEIFDVLIFDTELEFNEDSALIEGVSLDDNSIRAASRILRDNFRLMVPHISVQKHLPIAGGVGGGSSDAACFINAVFDIWGFSHEEKMLALPLFKPLGADTIVFLWKYFKNTDCAIYVNGTWLDGDGTIRPFDLPHNEYHIPHVLLVNDGSKLHTKTVFKKFLGKFRNVIGDEKLTFEILKNFHNSLQQTAISILPTIEDGLRALALTAPVFCGLSGSGPSCFGYYNSRDSALAAASMLPKYKFVKLSSF